MRRALIPGLPVPVFLPAGLLANVPGVAPGQPGAVPAVPGQNPAVVTVPPGSVDPNGYMTVPFMKSETEQILNELVAALQPANKAKVQGIPFVFDSQTSEVNAFAGCENGAPFMAMTMPLLRALGHIAEAKAADEISGTQRAPAYSRQAAEAMSAGAPIPDPAPGFYTPQEANDPRKLTRQRVLLNEMVGFVMGHELAHHYLGHTGCANGAKSGGIDPSVLFRIPSRAIPVFNQPIEAGADVNGVENLLDTGVARPGGLTEQGGILTLQFFGALQQLTPTSLATGILRTHPQPQLRIPLLQQTAQQWRVRRASGGTGGTSPAGPLPFPIPLPFLFPTRLRRGRGGAGARDVLLEAMDALLAAAQHARQRAGLHAPLHVRIDRGVLAQHQVDQARGRQAQGRRQQPLGR